MTYATQFIKFGTHLHKGFHPLEITSTGIKFNPEFARRLYDVEDEFKSLLIVPINEVVGKYNWVVTFADFMDQNFTLSANIYSDSEEAYSRIIDIIKREITGIEFKYFYKGNIDSYIDEKI